MPGPKNAKKKKSAKKPQRSLTNDASGHAAAATTTCTSGNSNSRNGQRERSPLEQAVLERRKVRAKNATKRSAALASLTKKADKLFQSGDLQNAFDAYVNIVKQHGRKPAILAKLVSIVSELKLWEETKNIATLALQADPRNVDVRFKRVEANKHLENFQAAEADLEDIIDCVPKRRKEAKAAMDDIEHTWDHCPGYELEAEVPDELERAWPNYHLGPDEYEDESDTEDSLHAGNGKPCSRYNHDGCKAGQTCEFSHSPDSRSVRDELGRNVCIYFLISECKFSDEECSYAHDKEYMPSCGWWDSPMQVELTADLVDFLHTSGRHACIEVYHLQLRDFGCRRRGPNLEKDLVVATLEEAGARVAEASFKATREVAAKAYFNVVMNRFENSREKFDVFWDALLEYTSNNIPPLVLAERVSEVFYNHPDLMEGFNLFMPAGWLLSSAPDKTSAGAWKVKLARASGFYTRQYGRGVAPYIDGIWDLEGFESDHELVKLQKLVVDIMTRYAGQPEIQEELYKKLFWHKITRAQVRDDARRILKDSPDLLERYFENVLEENM